MRVRFLLFKKSEPEEKREEMDRRKRPSGQATSVDASLNLLGSGSPFVIEVPTSLEPVLVRLGDHLTVVRSALHLEIEAKVFEAERGAVGRGRGEEGGKKGTVGKSGRVKVAVGQVGDRDVTNTKVRSSPAGSGCADD